MNITRKIIIQDIKRIVGGRLTFTNSYSTSEASSSCGAYQWSHRSYATNRQKSMPSIETISNLKAQNLEIAALSIPNRLPHSIVQSAEAVNVLKKRSMAKKRRNSSVEELSTQETFNVAAFATAEEYDLEKLMQSLTEQQLYDTKRFFSTNDHGAEQDVLYVAAKHQVGNESKDIFFFREGSVVLWNFNELETNNILSFLRDFEKDAYSTPIVRGESEIMPYSYMPESVLDVDTKADTDIRRAVFHNGKYFLTSNTDNYLEKYSFSNAMATSIKLGVWEAALDRYIDSIEYLTDDLKKGRRIRISRKDVLCKTGEIFALRHAINLSSDLLDTPDFYWDREELETLYLEVCRYFSVSRRTKVMNEKINHCVELAELISHNLNDAHHVRLEWMIIILIMVEVGFEIVHYMDRYYSKDEHEVANV